MQYRCYSKLLGAAAILVLLMSTAWGLDLKRADNIEVGAMHVEVVLDSVMPGDVSILQGTTPQMLEQYIPGNNFQVPMNAILVRKAESVTLIDTGVGANLVEQLKLRGITPEQVQNILITHMHFDHIGGMLHEGQVVFPNAKVYIAQPELAYWKDSKNIEKFPEEQQEMIRGFFKKSQDVLAAYKDSIISFVPGDLSANGKPLLEGINAVAAYGHTPGHTVFLLHDGDKKLLVVGDTLHVGKVQFDHPEVTVVYDVDQKEAAKTRQAIFNFAAANAIPLAGMHQFNPEIGVLQAKPDAEGGYHFIAID